MFRLLQAVETDVLAAGVVLHQADVEAAPVTEEALDLLAEHGTRADGMFPVLAQKAAGGDPTVAPSFAYLAAALLAVVRRG